jgi:hypothetical protein
LPKREAMKSAKIEGSAHRAWIAGTAMGRVARLVEIG